MENIFDSLVAISERVDESNIIIYALVGLGKDYTKKKSTQNKETEFTLSGVKSRFLCLRSF